MPEVKGQMTTRTVDHPLFGSKDKKDHDASAGLTFVELWFRQMVNRQHADVAVTSSNKGLHVHQ